MGQLEKTPASELERQLFGEIPQELYLLTDDSLKGLVVHKEEVLLYFDEVLVANHENCVFAALLSETGAHGRNHAAACEG